MAIELNANRITPVSSGQPPQQVRAAAPARDEATFSGAAALTEALAQLPDTRPEVVQRAREVVGTVMYPPSETLDRIAKLLAINILGKAD
jgi:hypothetical protein